MQHTMKRAIIGVLAATSGLFFLGSMASAAPVVPVAVNDNIPGVTIGVAISLDVDINDFYATGLSIDEWNALEVHCVVITPPAHGTLVIDSEYAPGCDFEYTPGSDFPGIDTVTYQLISTRGAGKTAVVTYTGPAAPPPTTVSPTTVSPTTVSPTTTAVPTSSSTTTTTVVPKVLAVTVTSIPTKAGDVSLTTLPKTGSNPAGLIALAALFLVAGLKLVAMNRQRTLRR